MAGSIFYKSSEHKERFIAAMKQIKKFHGKDFDSEYGAALYILTLDAHTWDKVKNCVSENRIDFTGMLTHLDWTGGYRVLIQLAYNLFSGAEPINVVEITYRLDESNYQVAMNAFQIRRYGLSAVDPK